MKRDTISKEALHAIHIHNSAMIEVYDDALCGILR